MNKIDMSLGWFTLGSSGDVKITSLNVGGGTLITNRVTRRVGVNVEFNDDMISAFQIGKPVGSFPEDARTDDSISLLVFSEKGYRPTSFNQIGGGSFGFSDSLSSTIWVNTNDIVPPGQGTGISFGGKTPNGHVPFARMTGIRADDVLDRGGFSIEVLDTLPNNPQQFGDLSGKPVLFERMRITGDGKVGFGGVSDPQFGIEIREDLGCDGIFNGGYERYSPTFYNVSGSTVTDLNSVNVFGNLTLQTETWYYSFENKQTLPSRGNCSTFDDDSYVYSAFDIRANTGDSVGMFFEGDILVTPPVGVSMSNNKLGMVTKNSPFGELIWALKFYSNDTTSDVSISSVSISRNRNSVSSAKRYDVYVFGVVTGDKLKIYSSELNNWNEIADIQFSSSGGNCFLARFESVFTDLRETGVTIKEIVEINGPRSFPIGIDVLFPETFSTETISNETRCAFALASLRDDVVFNKGVTIKYSNSFLVGSTVTTVIFSSVSPMVTHDIPTGNYHVSVFRIGGDGGNYLNGNDIASYYINTNITNALSFFINKPPPALSNPQLPLIREGTLRMSYDIARKSVYLTIPVNTGDIKYSTPGDEDGKLLNRFWVPGSIVIKASDSLEFEDIDNHIRLLRGDDDTTHCISKSIDVDRGRIVDGDVQECVYIAGSFMDKFYVGVGNLSQTTSNETLDITELELDAEVTLITLTTVSTYFPGARLVVASQTDLSNYLVITVTSYSSNILKGNITFINGEGSHSSWFIDRVNPIQTPSLEESSAFLLKFSHTGNVVWTVVVDGDNEDEGISVVVQNDILLDNSGDYNIYLSGTMKGNGLTNYFSKVFDATSQPLVVSNISSVVITQSEVGPIGGHEESFILKFNFDGKFLFNYKVTGTQDVAIKYIDYGLGGNVVMCGLMNTSLMRVHEPDGAITRYVPMEKYQRGFVVKFRTAGVLILPTPTGENKDRTFRKSIINTTGQPLYVSVYNLSETVAQSVPSISVIPSRKIMDFIYDSETWVPEASDKLTTDLLFLDRDNGRFGFGTTFPRATVDIRGDMIVDGFAKIGRDVDINGRVDVRGNITCGDIGENSSINVLTADIRCPYKISFEDGESEQMEDLIPAGMVVMWAGAVTDIPFGWALCDGLNGTPDLRGRFVIGYNDIENSVPNGPDSIFNPGGLPYSPPILNIGDVSGESVHLLTEQEMPSHAHRIPWRNQEDDGTVAANNNSEGTSFTSNDNGDDFTDYVGGDAPHNNMPPYYVLAFIIKL